VATANGGTKHRNGGAAMNQFRQHKLRYQASFSDYKAYIAAGSIRNTAYDEEFFRVFCQYLDEAIEKLKMQESDATAATEEYGEEMSGEEEEFRDKTDDY